MMLLRIAVIVGQDHTKVGVLDPRLCGKLHGGHNDVRYQLAEGRVYLRCVVV